MADNTVLPVGTGGDTIRDIDRSGIKTQVMQVDIGGASSESLLVRGQQTMANALPVVIASDQSAVPTKYAATTATDKSGTITAGGTAQTAIASNANRRAYWIQNLSAGDLWLSDTTTAVQASPSMKLVSGALYESQYGSCPTSAISIIGATTAQAFAARELT